MDLDGDTTNESASVPSVKRADSPLKEDVPVPGPSSAMTSIARKPSSESALSEEDDTVSVEPIKESTLTPSTPPPPPRYSISVVTPGSSPSQDSLKGPPKLPLPQPVSTKKYFPMELYVTLVSAFSFLCIGLMRSYTSPAISSMRSDYAFFHGAGLSKTTISWVAASPPLASFFGTILSGLSLQYCGRQKTLIILTLPFIAGWLMIGFATNISMIMTGRALTGLAAGFATATAQLYISECVRAKVRGFLGFVPTMMLSLGILLGFAMSTINLNWQDLALLMTCFPILMLLLTLAVPESPSWLMYRGKEREAVESLTKLRGLNDTNNSHHHTNDQGNGNVDNKSPILNEEIEKELEEMRRVMRKTLAADKPIIAAFVEEGDKNSSNTENTEAISSQGEDQLVISSSEEPQDFIQFVFEDLLGKREIWFPAFISLSLMVFQQFTGANAIIYYLSLILNEAEPKNSNSSLIEFFESQNNGGSSTYHTPHGLDVNVSSVIVGLVQFFAFFLSLPLIDRLGRRVLLIASAVLMIFPHLVLGIYFFMKLHPNTTIHVHNYSWKFLDMVKLTSDWLPLLCLCAFIAAYSIGFGPVPFIIMSEVFPSSARSYMCALASLVNHLTLFFIVRVFPTLMDWFGMEILFWMFAVFCLLAAIHVAIFVPETKGKTLAEIELGFMGKDRRNSRDSTASIGEDEKKNIKKNAKSTNNSPHTCQCNCKH
jgi:MFS family permease